MQVKEAVMDISNLYTRRGILPCVRRCDGAGPGPGLLCHYVYYFYYNLGVACGGRGAGGGPACVMRTVMDTSIAEPGTCVALLRGPGSI